MEKYIIAVNLGSSSREYAVYKDDAMVESGYYEQENGQVTLNLTKDDKKTTLTPKTSLEESFTDFICRLKDSNIDTKLISAIGFRVVVPGRMFLEHRVIDHNILEQLKKHAEDAPLHILPTLNEIKLIKNLLPGAKLCAISDSAFHKTILHEARNYAIPRSDADKFDIYRFGYHGLSISSVVNTLKQNETLPEKLIICHLGSGSSVTMLKNGRSLDTSMGYSPLEGLIMSTRSGSIDITAALELKRKHGFNDEQLLDYLNKSSGLLGISESSNDIRELLEKEKSGDENAKFALDMMVYRIRFYLGAYIASLEGLDAIVFTATVGERSSEIRSRICSKLSVFGVNLDKDLNNTVHSGYKKISSNDSRIKVYVIETDELFQIASETKKLLHNSDTKD